MLGEKAKYIIFDKRYPVIFHNCIAHNEIMAGSYAGKPTSAGFVTLVPTQTRYNSHICAVVSSGSISLNLTNEGILDQKLIENLINEQ